MNSKIVVKFVSLMVLIVMLLGSSTSTSAVEMNQIRPNVIYRNVSQYHENTILKGNNTDSKVELVLNSAVYAGQRFTVRGDPVVTQNINNITVEGNVLGTWAEGRLRIISGYQKDSYLDSFPIDKRFSVRPVTSTNSDSRVLPVNRTFELDFDYNSLQANENFTEINRDNLDLTGFVYRNANIRHATINDSNGDALVNVVGFYLTIKIAIYKTSTKELVGLHSGTILGYGNIFPANVREYITSQNGIDTASDLRGLAQLQGSNVIDWYSVGYNNSLGLDIYMAQFKISRQSSTLLFTPANSFSSLSLNSVSSDLEMFMDDLVSDNSLDVQDSEVEDFDQVMIDQAMSQEGLVVDSTASGTDSISEEGTDNFRIDTLSFNTAAIFGGQILALLAIGNVLYRRYRR